MSDPTDQRLTRLLALVSYLGQHPGIPVAEVAAHFDVTPAQVLSDVNLLWVSGTPGYLPDDLIDFAADELDNDVLTLTNPRGMDRPLRLATGEALALLVALRTLTSLAEHGSIGLAPTVAALRSATAKLTAAAGQAADEARAVQVQQPAAADSRQIREAMTAGRRLRLTYVSAADVVTSRDVDPLELVWDGASWYLRAWCHRVNDERHFRTDRILSLQVLPEAAEHPPTPRGSGAGPDLTDAALVVELDLASRARWVAERFPVIGLEDLEDGGLRVQLRVADPAWLANLVLGLGEDVRALRPPQLAGDIAAGARAALAADEALSSMP